MVLKLIQNARKFPNPNTCLAVAATNFQQSYLALDWLAVGPILVHHVWQNASMEGLGVKFLHLLVILEVNFMLLSIAFFTPTCEAEVLSEVDCVVTVHARRESSQNSLVELQQRESMALAEASTMVDM